MTNLMNTWWHLTADEQAALRPEPQDTYTITARYHDSTGWCFDLPELGTYAELLMQGTELVLNYWYHRLTKKEAGADAEMTMIINKQRPPIFDTHLTFQHDDPHAEGASFYKEQATGLSLWLCKYLPWLMHGKPSDLWVTFRLVD